MRAIRSRPDFWPESGPGSASRSAAYRLSARRLQTALDGFPAALLQAQLGALQPCVRHALEQHRFEAHGVLHGRAGRRAYVTAAALLRRLARRFS